MGSEGKGKSSSESSSVILGMLLNVASAIVSAIASLVCERLLKEEDLPFHIQKVRLDLGSVITSVALLFFIGSVSARPQDAFWKNRPLDTRCDSAPCWEKRYLNNTI